MWTIDDTARLYKLDHWADSYFGISKDGSLTVRPRRNAEQAIDLHALASSLHQHGLCTPVLLRFPGILHDRIERLCGAFAHALQRTGHEVTFTAAYPIKVNQQHSVISEILSHGNARVGLEAGSKPELVVAMALSGPGQQLICNGYKDREYLQLALLARKIDIQTTIVLEKPSELEQVLRESGALGVKPRLGFRARLTTVTAGKWQNSGGQRSKFGLQAGQMIDAINRLRTESRLDCLRLLHFHMGSQVANIQDIERAVTEAARHYIELRKLGAPIDTVDVGGGLGIDYEGTRSHNYFSVNYDLQSYADCIVNTFHRICAGQQQPFPALITESGRAMTAHHAVLVTNVTDIERSGYPDCPETDDLNRPEVVSRLHSILTGPAASVTERWHDAQHWLARAQQGYENGELNLHERASAEAAYNRISQQIQRELETCRGPHRDILDKLHQTLADKYFCNLSIFQSLPDVWGIGQVFPIMPLQRLHEFPDRRAILEDLTCDSDGQIEKYVDSEGIDCSLPVHAPLPDEPYFLGFFLAGAYQEVLGDIHNLFGDTDSANVTVNKHGEVELSDIRRGDTVRDLLRLVNHDPDEIQALLEKKVSSVKMATEQTNLYLNLLREGLDGYSYLED